MELVELVFSSFWKFVGALIFSTALIYIPIAGITEMIQAIFRHRAIMQNGYPPKHCTANGEVKKSKSKGDD